MQPPKKPFIPRESFFYHPVTYVLLTRIRLSTDSSTTSASSCHRAYTNREREKEKETNILAHIYTHTYTHTYRSISTHTSAKRNKIKHANKKESGTALTTGKAPFAARYPRFVPKEQGEKITGKRKKEREERQELEQRFRTGRPIFSRRL